jgi:DNA-binding protein YbaB
MELALDSACAAINTALAQAEKDMEAELAKVTGGAKIPGLI